MDSVTKIRLRAACCFLWITVALLIEIAPLRADTPPAALPTFSPIVSRVMLSGRGSPFTEQSYQMVSPLLRKCDNDWPSTRYVEYRPEMKGMVVIAKSSTTAISLLEILSQQTGRRFAVQRGLEERAALVSSDGEEWTVILKRFARDTGLSFEAVQDIAVLSDPATAQPLPNSLSSLLPLLVGASIAGGVAWFSLAASRRKAKRDVRGGWHDN